VRKTQPTPFFFAIGDEKGKTYEDHLLAARRVRAYLTYPKSL
jgi:hypothetical protein